MAFGRTGGSTPDRFLVGLAVLSLMAAAAADQPLLCVVDDAQWLDQVSVQTLAFVARRLMAEPVALVFGARDNGAETLAGLPETAVEGLSDGDARDLLESVMFGGIDPLVRDRIVAETRGVPLAILEVPRSITATELAGGFWISREALVDGGNRATVRPSHPVASRADPETAARRRRRTGRRCRAVPARRSTVGHSGRRTGSGRSCGSDRVRPADAVSSPVDAVGRLPRRRTDRSPGDPPRAGRRDRSPGRIPTVEPGTPRTPRRDRTNAVAAELEASAGRAQSRGGVAAAAAFLERAAILTSDPALRGARAIAAAQAKREAAAPEAAYELLAIAELAPLSKLQRAQVGRMRAQMEFVRSRAGAPGAAKTAEAAAQLLSAAKGLDDLDDDLARETHLEALAAAMYAGRLAPPTLLADVATAGRASVEPAD